MIEKIGMTLGSFIGAVVVGAIVTACSGQTSPTVEGQGGTDATSTGSGAGGKAGGGGTAGGGMACVPGQQVACACPGSAMGAQACNAEGTGYIACECGSAGTGGTQEAGADGPSSADSSDAYAETEGGLGPQDDPCPTGTFINCSTSCDNQQVCPASKCVDRPPKVVSLSGYTMPTVVRTPSGVVPDDVCDGCKVYSFALSVPFSARIEVQPPWYLAHLVRRCSTFGQCAQVYSDNGITIAVATQQPNAPARNVTITAYRPYGADDGGPPCTSF